RERGVESRCGDAEPKAAPRSLRIPGENGDGSLARPFEGDASVDVDYDTGIEEDDASRADGEGRAHSHGGIAREADARVRGKLERPERAAELGKGRRLLERHGRGRDGGAGPKLGRGRAGGRRRGTESRGGPAKEVRRSRDIARPGDPRLEPSVDADATAGRIDHPTAEGQVAPGAPRRRDERENRSA